MLRMLRKIIPSQTDRVIRECRHIVDNINQLESKIQSFSDAALANQTDVFKKRIFSGETEDSLLPEAFATVREASRRVLGMRHFDVQLIGGIVLHRRMIAEMATGEGKTLVATLPVYLNALSGKGVHVVTVNDYLASRDAHWMGEVYNFLGLTVGSIISSVPFEERKKIYTYDIVYGTNNEFGFDFLRDNLKTAANDFIQRNFHYAIIDEVDSILIDEARTPLIISGPAEDSSALYVQVNKIIPFLQEGVDYEKDEKQDTVTLTEHGNEHVESLLLQYGLLNESLYDANNVALVHHINQALRAHVLYHRDIDYIVKDGAIVIIDEFTGRMMEGRRYSDGLHQALEAKEKVKIQLENQTLASITFQNYFRMYPKLAGMTGTGATESEEFEEIYNLQVVTIPTHKPVTRIDHQDEVYLTKSERDRAVLSQIELCYQKKQPVLVGTTSIENSESLSRLLKKKKIPHSVLNAKHHEKESQIIAQAGIPGTVTIATNMAGRGTDIQLGGNLDMCIMHLKQKIENTYELEQAIARAEQEVKIGKKEALSAGGLYVIGTERHESRRIDNQLRGRSGRQGDPGNSKFYISLQDNLMRIFGSNRLERTLQRLGIKEGEAIIHPWISKAIEKAQKKVEERNFEIRKHLLEYDDVINDQRKVIFQLRHEILDQNKALEHAIQMRDDVLMQIFSLRVPKNSRYVESWNIDGLHDDILRLFAFDLPISTWVQENTKMEDLLNYVRESVLERWACKQKKYSDDFSFMVSHLLLQVLDHVWKDHLLQLDYIRCGIGLRAYAQVNPLNEYKRESFLLFESMLRHFSEMSIQMLFHVEFSVRIAEDIPTVSRNALCPCGSKKKYKHCHGKP